MNFLGPEHWPWWAGALALSVVAVGFAWVLRRPFGVSGILERVLDPVRTLEADRAHRAAEDREALMAALAKATHAAFGDEVERTDDPDDGVAARPARDDYPLHFLFLVSIAFGGLLGALGAGDAGTSTYAGAFRNLFGDGGGAVLVLVLGGALVGFGVQMSGGCTSGHGLTGCSRVQPASVGATATFFGVGILVSLLLSVVLT